MDAPTSTSSADGGDSGGNSGDWGWFTPSSGKNAEPDDRQPAADGTADGPSRPVSRIRPVGSGAERRTGALAGPGPGGPAPQPPPGASGPAPQPPPGASGPAPQPPLGPGTSHGTSGPFGPRTTVPGQGAQPQADPLAVSSLYREEPPRHREERRPEERLQRQVEHPRPEDPQHGEHPRRHEEPPQPPHHQQSPHHTQPPHHQQPPHHTQSPDPEAHPRHSAEYPRPAEHQRTSDPVPAATRTQGRAPAAARGPAPEPVPAQAAPRPAGAPDAVRPADTVRPADAVRRPWDATRPADAAAPAHPDEGRSPTGPVRTADDRFAPGATHPAATPDRPVRSAAPSGPAAGGLPSPGPAVALATPRPEAGRGSPDAVLIRRTMAEIEPIADKVTSYFYALLFVGNPELRDLFPASMDSQRDRLFRALLTAARHVDDTDTLTEYLSHLGRGHRKYGTLPDHYPAVGECLIGALTRYAARSWDAETEAAWVRAYTTISQIMIDAAAEDELHHPAWWQAEVVAHELRTNEIAVVTVRPDQPYAFRAGQYTSLETPWWPRVWRHYSFASAPRPDGLLSFHVKAVPAGWVSSALVNRARPGDVLRLGPPAGSMTVDHSTDNGLLCLGGGTGIAPIKALVEDVAEHGRTRPVEVFYGARHDQDLYDMDTMIELERAHPWLSVRPVVSDGPTAGLSGQLPDAVRRYGPWNAYDAYLSGPPGMIRSGVDALVGAGVPTHRIRHDSIEELVATGD